MDIKLKAKLCAYSKIESFESTADGEHNCKFMTPVTEDQIDELFRASTETIPPENNSGSTAVTGQNFIDQLFQGG